MCLRWWSAVLKPKSFYTRIALAANVRDVWMVKGCWRIVNIACNYAISYIPWGDNAFSNQLTQSEDLCPPPPPPCQLHCARSWFHCQLSTRLPDFIANCQRDSPGPCSVNCKAVRAAPNYDYWLAVEADTVAVKQKTSWPQRFLLKSPAVSLTTKGCRSCKEWRSPSRCVYCWTNITCDYNCLTGNNLQAAQMQVISSTYYKWWKDKK